MRVTLGGAAVDLVGREDVMDDVHDALAGHGRRLLLTSADLDHIHLFGADSGREGTFDSESDRRWIVTPRSACVLWTAERVTGFAWEQLGTVELVPELLRAAARTRSRVGVLGGSEAQLAAVSTVFADRFADVEVAGMWSPDRERIDDPASSRDLAREIDRAGTDLLVVALGKPRQEEWLGTYLTATDVRVAAAVGRAGALLTELGASSAGRRFATRTAVGRIQHEVGRAVSHGLLRRPASVMRLLTNSRSGAAPDIHPKRMTLSTPARWRRRFGRVLAVADAANVGVSSLIAYQLRESLGQLGVVQPFQNELPTALAVIPLWLTILYLAGSYRPQYLNAGGEAFRRFIAGALGGLLGLGFVSFALNLQLSRMYVAVLFGLVLAIGVGVRVFAREYLRRQRSRGRYVQNVILAGADEDAIEVASAMRRHLIAGYRVVGFVDDDLEVGSVAWDDLRVLGRPEEILDLAYDHRAGLVVASPSGLRPGALRELTVTLEGSPVDLAVAPSLFQVVSRRVTVESVDNVPVLHVDQIRLERGKAIAKRVLDLIVSGVLLLLGWPLMVAAMIAIKLDSSGPVLFKQRRVGRDGVRFTMLKFRTMVDDAEARLDEISDLNEVGHRFFKIREDPRVTPVGRFLRKWSIDEMPQLWNVLRSDMSMVGPRPPLPAEVEKYEPWHLRRLRVRPGITGIWQVSGRSDVPFDEAVRLDLFYIENWSLGYDLWILARTVLAVLGRSGAY